MLSIEAQLAELYDFAKQQNLFIARKHYESKTAKEPGREVFNEMLGEIERGRRENHLPREHGEDTIAQAPDLLV